jgi:hypothetical protein
VDVLRMGLERSVQAALNGFSLCIATAKVLQVFTYEHSEHQFTGAPPGLIHCRVLLLSG